MSDFGPESTTRVQGVTIVKPIIYGNSAQFFGKKREDDGHTHQWTVFVKPYRNEDMSAYVKKVHFKLHESYTNQNRVVLKPPYEVTETGWGEFEIVIKIYFQDPNERSVTIYHLLKLFQTEQNTVITKQNLTSENYDELVFHEPSVGLHELLVNPRPFTLGTYKHETDFEEKKESTLNLILNSRSKVRAEIKEMNERLKKTQGAVEKFQEELKALSAAADKK